MASEKVCCALSATTSRSSAASWCALTRDLALAVASPAQLLDQELHGFFLADVGLADLHSLAARDLRAAAKVRQHRKVAAHEDHTQVTVVCSALGKILQDVQELGLGARELVRVVDDQGHRALVLHAADTGETHGVAGVVPCALVGRPPEIHEGRFSEMHSLELFGSRHQRAREELPRCVWLCGGLWFSGLAVLAHEAASNRCQQVPLLMWHVQDGAQLPAEVLRAPDVEIYNAFGTLPGLSARCLADSRGLHECMSGSTSASS